jgi:hypothetical protein
LFCGFGFNMNGGRRAFAVIRWHSFLFGSQNEYHLLPLQHKPGLTASCAPQASVGGTFVVREGKLVKDARPGRAVRTR